VVAQKCIPWKVRLMFRAFIPWRLRRLLTRGRVNLNTPEAMDERYENQGEHFSSMENLYHEILPLLPTSGRLLDAGCGIAVLLRTIQKELPHLDLRGVDFSHVAVERTRGYGFEAKECALPDLPYPDAFFDCIVCTEVLEHLDQPEETLRAFYQSLVRGGRLVISVPHGMGPDECSEHVQDFTEETLRRCAEQAGFKVHSGSRLGSRFILCAWLRANRNGVQGNPISLWQRKRYDETRR